MEQSEGCRFWQPFRMCGLLDGYILECNLQYHTRAIPARLSGVGAGPSQGRR